jgi:hypothetical protein
MKTQEEIEEIKEDLTQICYLEEDSVYFYDEIIEDVKDVDKKYVIDKIKESIKNKTSFKKTIEEIEEKIGSFCFPSHDSLYKEDDDDYSYAFFVDNDVPYDLDNLDVTDYIYEGKMYQTGISAWGDVFGDSEIDSILKNT